MFQSLNSILTFCLRNPLQNSLFFNAAPKYSLSSVVILMFVLSKRGFAVSKNPGFTISHDLFAFRKYPNMEPKSLSLFHHCINDMSGPPAASSSAYQTCFASLVCTFGRRGLVAKAYTGIARESPCVVPSIDSKSSLPTNNLVGSLYVLTRVGKIAGQFMDIFLNAT